MYARTGSARERIAALRDNQRGQQEGRSGQLIAAGIAAILLVVVVVIFSGIIHPSKPGSQSAVVAAATGPSSDPAAVVVTASPAAAAADQPPATATGPVVDVSGSGADTATPSPGCEAAPTGQPVAGGKVVATHAGTVKFQGRYAYVVGAYWTTVYYPVSGIDQTLLWQQVSAGKELGRVPAGQPLTYEIWQCQGS